MPNIRISDMPLATLPLVGDELIETVQGGFSRQITVDNVIAAAAALDATFVTVSANPNLDNERILTAGTGIGIVDSGAGLPITISVTSAVLQPEQLFQAGVVVVNTRAQGEVGLRSNVVGTTPPIPGDAPLATLDFYNIIGITRTGRVGFNGIGGNLLLSNEVHGANVLLLAEDTAGVPRILLTIDPDAQSVLLPLSNDATTPTLAFGDGDTGFFESADDTLGVSIAAARRLFITTQGIFSDDAAGAAFLDEAATSINPSLVPNRADLDTGIGWTAADQLSLIAGGAQIVNLTEVAGVIQLVVPLQNNAVSPSIAFGDGDSGFYEPADDTLRVTIAGVDQFSIVTARFSAINGAAILNEVTSATNPVLVPLFTDINTGIGTGGTDQLSLIAGGLDCINIAETAAARQVGFYVTAPISLQTGVAVTAAGIHAALVNLGLITA